MFHGGIDTKIVREVTGHASDAITKYQVTSDVQKQEVSNVLKGDGLAFINEKEQEEKVEIRKPPTPSLEISVSEGQKNESPIICSCKRQSFDVSNSENLSKMIGELVSRRSSGCAKIKLEIEFSN